MKGPPLCRNCHGALPFEGRRVDAWQKAWAASGRTLTSWAKTTSALPSRTHLAIDAREDRFADTHLTAPGPGLDASPTRTPAKGMGGPMG